MEIWIADSPQDPNTWCVCFLGPACIFDFQKDDKNVV